MFWKKKNNPTNNDAAKKHEFILQIATLQWMLLVTARISKAYDTQKIKRQKILTYMYYEGLAGTLIGDDTEEQRARISLAREACLELFESKGDEQYLVSRESTQNSLGKDHRIHAEVEAFLSQHKMFANAAIDKIEKFLAVFVIDAKSEKDLDQIKTHLHDLVLDEELENVLCLAP